MSCNCNGYGAEPAIPGLPVIPATVGAPGAITCQNGYCAAAQATLEARYAEEKKSGYIVGGIIGLVVGAVIIKAIG